NSRKRKNYRDIPGNQRPLGIVRGQALQATIIVAGVPGAGKTTILQELEAVATERKVPLKIVNFGNVTNELLKNRGVEIHRDHMRTERTRYRDSQYLDDAKGDLRWSRHMASAIAVLAAVPIQILQSRPGQQRQSAEELLKIIEKRS